MSHIAISWHPPDGPSHFLPPELVYALHVEPPRVALHTLYDVVLLPFIHCRNLFSFGSAFPLSLSSSISSIAR
jgi:hypothetical protein